MAISWIQIVFLFYFIRSKQSSSHPNPLKLSKKALKEVYTDGGKGWGQQPVFPVCLSVCLSVPFNKCVCLTVCLSIYLDKCMCVTVCLADMKMSVSLSVCLSNCLYFYYKYVHL